MIQTLRSIALLAFVLLLVGALGGLWFEGAHFALGVALTGGLMIASMGLGALAMRRVEGAAGAPPPLLALPFLLKVPLIGVAGWLLLRSFPPLSVILGGGVLITAISLHTALGAFLPSPARKA